MKNRHLLAAVALMFCIHASCQVIELSFTGIFYNSYEQIDSIKITNQTDQVDTMLYYPDTVLVLDCAVGVPGTQFRKEGFRVMPSYPNPSTDYTNISICVPYEGNVILTVSDASGKKLVRSERILSGGNHIIRFTPGRGNLFFFSASWKGEHDMIRIISTSSGKDQCCSLAYSGYTGAVESAKSYRDLTVFTYHIGDEMIYTGYADTLKAVIQDSPASNETYVFNFAGYSPCPGEPVVFYEGKGYHTIQIDTLCWFKENLDVGVRKNGIQNQTNNGIKEKYCYSDLDSLCDIYGGLYQWNEMMQYSTAAGAQGLCPSGWHIPSDYEWSALINYLGGSTVAGGKLKETGYAHWQSPNTGATNESGFTGLPGGLCDQTGQFGDLKLNGNFWTSTMSSSTDAWYWHISHISAGIGRSSFSYDKSYGFSVRCLRDY